jgi:drug/metabolite transporter (DMT)-like permease
LRLSPRSGGVPGFITMFYVLALASAFVYGAADFLGGLTARRAGTIAVVLVSQGTGLALLGLTLPLLPGSSPKDSDWIWSGVAGLTGGVGVALLYRALAVGTMAIVAPVTAVCAVALPVLVAVALGERPGARATAGIALAIGAIILVSQQETASEAATGSSGSRRTSGLRLALASGVAIGLFFLSLARTSADAGLWPMLVARVVSVTLFAAFVLIRRQSVRMPRSVAVIVLIGGGLDMLANVLYLLASRLGPLSVVVTLSSLYPASTVLLARVVLGERLSGRQTIGICCALVAVVLIVDAS